MTVLGIDYSRNCPALCLIGSGHPLWWVNYKISGTPYPNISGIVWTESSTQDDTARFVELANWVLGVINITTPDLIVLEDYAFAAPGRITQLAENGGVLKAALHETFPEIPLRIIAPTTMKKFATGRGIATKDDIWAAFVKKDHRRAAWQLLCHPRALRVTSPMADVADAYFLADYGRQHFLSDLT